MFYACFGAGRALVRDFGYLPIAVAYRFGPGRKNPWSVFAGVQNQSSGRELRVRCMTRFEGRGCDTIEAVGLGGTCESAYRSEVEAVLSYSSVTQCYLRTPKRAMGV